MDLDIIDEKLVNKLSELPLDYWDFRDEDTRELTHGIHTYPAVMVYPISRNLISYFRTIQGVKNIFDPFMGSGTVLIEGLLSGMAEVTGVDLNPLARLISKVKATPLEPSSLYDQSVTLADRIGSELSENTNMISGITPYVTEMKGLDITSKNGWGKDAYNYTSEYLDNHKSNIRIPNFPNMGYWFLPRVILELSIIKSCINEIENGDIKDFFLVSFSETVRYVSNQRNGEFKMFRMPTEKLLQHSPDTFKEFRRVTDKNLSKMKSYYERFDRNNLSPVINIINNDTRVLSDIPDNYFDLMITSPPYGDSRTTVAYGEFSRLSLQWLGFEDYSDRDIKSIDKNLVGGIRTEEGYTNSLESTTLISALSEISKKDPKRAREVHSFYVDLDKCISAITKKMKINSYQCWVMGNRTVKDVKLLSNQILVELAALHGLEHVCTIGRNIPNKVMPSLNSPTNITGEKGSTMTNEHIVFLRKKD